MVVVILENSPPKLRGDLTRWLIEIAPGVYCGNVSARVREELWVRICENIKDGRASMVHSASGEQRMDFKVHNSDWEPVEIDGIKLIRHPPAQKRTARDIQQTDKLIQQSRYMKKPSLSRAARVPEKEYCVVDLETTGLSIDEDEIIEIALLRIRDGAIAASYQALLTTDRTIPKEITSMTGITDQLLKRDGKPPQLALKEAVEFIGADTLIGYNVKFDYEFLLSMIERYRLPRYRCGNRFDVMSYARRKMHGLSDYKLSTVAEHMQVEHKPAHRAMADCLSAYEVFIKLKEKPLQL